ncbi:oxygen-insensitive NADPH nitroreductase [Exiguobacterium sp. RIT594]|uniref:oxygen-insensitive NADPH nitroreductase n=1 Tax=Exiguobacterium sp. RIT594 TaxID=2282449 RepID=UPI000DF7CE96|nr:oxygen-insensitive NADPH nitroreductase [Exiguobacterium sp. RIT594]RDB32709.1 oxygen-insensitive NADPH nitroreductase [Exiguobacterium sp. RIT594]
MNETIEQLLSHRSIRKFKPHQLDQETIETLVRSAQSASTSSYQQAYAIIGVEDEGLKQQLVDVASGQSYVAENSYFFVFCIDYHKHILAAEIASGSVDRTVETTEALIVGAVDAGLAAQNLVIAAESLGYGTVYIGSLRNDAAKVSELLALPNHVVPLFGVAVGIPDQQPGKKPRLPMDAVFHRNTYTNDDTMRRLLSQYENETSVYYGERTDGRRTEGWVYQMAASMKDPKRTYMRDFLQKKHLARD